MSTTLLIIGGNSQLRDIEIELRLKRFGFKSFKDNPDIVSLKKNEDKPSIGIEEIRDLKRRILLKPFFEEYRAIIINNAQDLTIEAQNALLKTLEEPPEHTIIILCTDILERLLPTVISRCEIVKIQNAETAAFNKDLTEYESVLQQIKKRDFKNGWKVIKHITDRNDAINFVNKLISLVHKQLNNCSEEDLPTWERAGANLLKTGKYLQANTNVRLTLENIFI